MPFCGNLYKERQIWVPEPHFAKLGWCTTSIDNSSESLWSTVYSPQLNFLHCLLRFRSYEAKCVRFGCFRRRSTFCTEISPGQGRPLSTIFVFRKLETLVYPTVKTASFTSFWHNTGVWRTERRTDGICRSIIIQGLQSYALRSAHNCPRLTWQRYAP